MTYGRKTSMATLGQPTTVTDRRALEAIKEKYSLPEWWLISLYWVAGLCVGTNKVCFVKYTTTLLPFVSFLPCKPRAPRVGHYGREGSRTHWLDSDGSKSAGVVSWTESLTMLVIRSVRFPWARKSCQGPHILTKFPIHSVDRRHFVPVPGPSWRRKGYLLG